MKERLQLEHQVKIVENVIDTPIIPPSLGSAAYELPIVEIRKRFPNRYQVYIDVLRGTKSRENTIFSVENGQRKVRSLIFAEQWKNNATFIPSLNGYIDQHYQGEKKTLRQRQMTVFEDIRDFIDDGGKDGYVRLPTGTGKTVLFIEVIEALKTPTLVVVPTNILVNQTEKRFEEFAPDLEIGKINAYAKERNMPITITTYASLIRGVKSGSIKPEDFKLLILDERHRATGKETSDAIDKFTNSIKLGFTATPRGEQGREIHRMPVQKAVEEGLLSPLSVYIAKTNIDLSKIQITSNGEYNQRDLDRAINISARNKAAVDLYKNMFDKQTGVAYCVGVDHAANLAKLFNEKGITAAVISGRNKSEHTSILEKYKSGEIKVLCNADILIEGFDEPRASVCLNLRPTLSRVIAEQRGGRVLRLDPQNPNKHAYIVDFVDENSKTITYAEAIGGATFTNSTKSAVPIITSDNGLRPQLEIEGLEVIIEAEEVMKLINEKAEIMPLLDSDFIFNSNAIRAMFHGRNDRVRTITEEVLQGLKDENANNVVNRLSRDKLGRTQIFTVIPDRQLFLERMMQKGLKLREAISGNEVFEPLKETEFGLSESNFLNQFKGSIKNIRVIAEQVVEELSSADPTLVGKRLSGNHVITAVLNRGLFISKMSERGIELQVRDPNLQPLQDGELPLTPRALNELYIGGWKKIREEVYSIANVLDELAQGFVVYRKSGSAVIRVVTDKELFMQKMRERGITPKNEAFPLLEPTDYALTNDSFIDSFIGGSRKLKPIAQRVIDRIRVDNPSLIIQKKIGTKTVDVIRDKDVFIKLMQEEGVVLRSDVFEIEELGDNEFPITYSSLISAFEGHQYRISPIADMVIEELSETNPEVVVKRRTGSRTITAVKDKNVFIKLMAKHGVVSRRAE